MMIDTERRMIELCRRAEAVWGRGAQSWIIIEEIGELLAALAQWVRGRATIEQVVDELADARIVLFQLTVMIDPSGPALVEKRVRYKLARLERRLLLAEGDPA